MPTNGLSCTLSTTELKLTKGKVNSIPFNQSRWTFEKSTEVYPRSSFPAELKIN
jgi:hypothetical protein